MPVTNRIILYSLAIIFAVDIILLFVLRDYFKRAKVKLDESLPESEASNSGMHTQNTTGSATPS